jgi:DNA-binding CsgD family transcriptional regulator
MWPGQRTRQGVRGLPSPPARYDPPNSRATPATAARPRGRCRRRTPPRQGVVRCHPKPKAPRSQAESLGLTPREAEVLALVAEGRTNRQIGQTLFITEKNASLHVSHILASSPWSAVARRPRLLTAWACASNDLTWSGRSSLVQAGQGRRSHPWRQVQHVRPAAGSDLELLRLARVEVAIQCYALCRRYTARYDDLLCLSAGGHAEDDDIAAGSTGASPTPGGCRLVNRASHQASVRG